MSNQATREVTRKLESFRLAQAATAETLQRAKAKEQSRLEELENVVAFVLDTNQTTQTAVAETLGCSRNKMNRMAQNARERNAKLLREGTN